VSVLNHLGQAAAVLLLIDLFVLVIIFAGVAGGLAFGLRWGRGKLGPLISKGEELEKRGAHYVSIGTDYGARPVIGAGGLAERVKGTVDALRAMVRRQRTGTRV